MSDEISNDEESVVLSAEIMDRAERKALKEKQRAEEAARKSPRSQDDIDAALARTKLANAEKDKRKRIFKWGSIATVVGLLGWGINYLFAPYAAGMTYGICKTYLELNVQFPQDLRISTVDDFGQYVRIWYVQVDAFGEYRMESIQCNFRADETTGAALEKISINRREVDPAKVAAFNTILPVILENPPDLTIPHPLPDSLENLQINTDAFRFQLNLPTTNFFGERKR